MAFLRNTPDRQVKILADPKLFSKLQIELYYLSPAMVTSV